MDFHGIVMYGDLETDNVKAKDSVGIKFYDNSAIIGFKVEDGGYIAAYTGVSINEFSSDGTLSGDSNIAVPTENAVKTYVDTNFQPLDTDLTAIAGLTPTDSNFIVGNGSAWIVETGATARTSLGLDSAAIRAAEDTLTNGSNLPDGAAIIAYGDAAWLNESSNLSDLVNTSTARTNLGVAIGSDIQAWNTYLDEIATITPSAGVFIVGNGSGWYGQGPELSRQQLGLDGNSNTTHYHDSRYYQKTEFTDGSTIVANINRIKLTGTSKVDGYFYAGSISPSASTRLNYDGHLYATRTYNPVYADYADFQELNDELVFGKVYYDTEYGAKLCNTRCQMSTIGIASDVYGQSCGIDESKNQVPISVAGWVLAHVDRDYPIGTPLTNDENGNLTEMALVEKVYYPERLLAIYKKKEEKIVWNNVVVDDRHWVKVK